MNGSLNPPQDTASGRVERESYRRKGKVARLPFDLRTQVNVRMRDGETYPGIAKWLAQIGHPGFSDNNLARWYQGGHEEWLREQARTENIRVRSEAQAAMLQELSGKQQSLDDANSMLLADTINEVLQELDPDDIKEMIKDDPKRFFDLAASVNSAASERSRRLKVELDLQKYRDIVAEQKRKIQDSLNQGKRKGGLSAEAIKQIEEAARLL